jgi:hypothetical protein
MDLYHNLLPKVSLPAAAYTKAGGAVEGAEVDRQGHERALVECFSGALGAQVNVYEVELVESDVSGSGFTAVADADLIGTEPTFDQAAGESNVVKTFEYVGSKRYLKANLKAPTGAGTGSGIIGANIVLGDARHNPVV